MISGQRSDPILEAAARVCTYPAVGTFGPLSQVNLAAKNGVVFHREAKRVNISFNHTACSQLDPPGRDNVALKLTHDQDILCREICGDVRIRSYGETAF
jgi:hypothetical protein